MERQTTLHAVFIDFAKAFDTIYRHLLWRILDRFGSPPAILSIIRSFHDHMKGRISIAGKQPERFYITEEVKQGCVLAPLLFNIYVSCIPLLCRRVLEKSSEVAIVTRQDGSAINIRHLAAPSKCDILYVFETAYTDDTTLHSSTTTGLRRTVAAMERYSASIGMSLNASKTSVLSVGGPQIVPAPTINNTALTQVSEATNLGSIVSAIGSIDAEVTRRVSQACGSLGRLRLRVFKNHDLKPNTQVAVYKAVVLPTLLYGSEKWTVYRRQI